MHVGLVSKKKDSGQQGKVKLEMPGKCPVARGRYKYYVLYLPVTTCPQAACIACPGHQLYLLHQLNSVMTHGQLQGVGQTGQTIDP